MTIVYSGSPGSASNLFSLILENILNCKCNHLNYANGIGHIFLKVPIKKKIFKTLNIDFFDNTSLIYGHIFPIKFNLDLLNNYYDIKHFIISYRNIYDQLNYLYKWQKYNFRSPLSFKDNEIYSKKNKFSLGNFDIDLNLLLVLNFYKQWFYLIQNKKLKNFTLFSFQEIISQNTNFKIKIKNIFQDFIDLKNFKFENEKYIKTNLYKPEKFETNPRHIMIIKDFISLNDHIDFSLII